MNYLPRTIQPVIEEASKFFKIVMVSGMRQVGKSTLLKQLSSDKRTIISFDDINNLESAKNAPLQFLQLNPPPCFFNQVQRVPEIFKALKISVDSRSEKGLYWLSGSQKLSLMSQVSDALPGRLMNFELWPFSIYEIAGKGLEQKPYLPSFSLSSNLPILDPADTWNAVFQGFSYVPVCQLSKGIYLFKQKFHFLIRLLKAIRRITDQDSFKGTGLK